MTYADITSQVRAMSGLPSEPLTLPLRGHTYTFPGVPTDPAVNAKLRIVEANHWAAQRGEIPQESVLSGDAQLLLSLVANEEGAMMANGVTEFERNHMAITVLFFYLFGPGMSRVFWQGGVKGMQEAAAKAQQ